MPSAIVEKFCAKRGSTGLCLAVSLNYGAAKGDFKEGKNIICDWGTGSDHYPHAAP